MLSLISSYALSLTLSLSFSLHCLALSPALFVSYKDPVVHFHLIIDLKKLILTTSLFHLEVAHNKCLVDTGMSFNLQVFINYRCVDQMSVGQMLLDQKTWNRWKDKKAKKWIKVKKYCGRFNKTFYSSKLARFSVEKTYFLVKTFKLDHCGLLKFKLRLCS